MINFIKPIAKPIVIFFLLAASFASLASFSACDSSSEQNDGVLRVPSQYPTIFDAVTAAQDGDIIEVEPGHYSESVDFMGKSITITSTDPDDPQVVADTIIDGDGGPCVVTFQSGEGRETLLLGVTVTGGKGSSSSNTEGGGVCVWNNSGPIIRKNIITENEANRGAGIIVLESWPLIEENSITLNLGNDRGAGIYVGSESDAEIQYNSVADNSGGDGAIHVSEENTFALIEGNSIENNQTDFGAGGIKVSFGANAAINENTITNNKGDSDNNAGGISVHRAFAAISGNEITANEKLSGTGGAGITVYGHHSEFASAEIEGNIISENLNHSSSGGGISVTYNASALIKDNVIEANQSSAWGGGIFVYNIAEDNEGETFLVEILNNEIRDNIITGIDSGGGIAIRGRANVDIIENTISGNTASEPGSSGSRNGGGISLQLDNTVATVHQNTITNNYAGSRGGGIYVAHNSTILGPSGESWVRQNSPPDINSFNTFSGNTHEDDCGEDVFFGETTCE